MLYLLTSLVDFLGMGVTLWLGLYLFGRGFPSRITLRAVVVLLALAAFFLGAYINLYHQIPGTAAGRAVLLTIGLFAWYDLTNRLLPLPTQRKFRWLVGVVYAFGLVTVALLLGVRNAFVGEVGNVLWVGRMDVGLPYLVYGLYQLTTSLAILYNFRLGAKVGVGPQNRYFFVASILSACTVGYGTLALALTPPLPRLIQDTLLFSSVTLLGFSVARYQTLVERRTTLQDFPVSALAVFALSAIYVLIAWRLGFPPDAFIFVAALAIFTHSTYDLAREFLDRLRYRSESALRRQLRRLESDTQHDVTLQNRLQEGLALLCSILDATGGFIAIRQEEQFVVSASHHSIPVGSVLPAPEGTCDDVCRPATNLAEKVARLAPAFESGKQVAVVGLGPPRGRLDYSEDHLDLLVEAADRVGTIVHLHSLQPDQTARLMQLASEVQSHEADLRARAEDLIVTLVTNPDPQFVKIVENGLRHISDVITLGGSPLAERLGVRGDTQVERGKALQRQLIQAVEVFRPTGQRPHEPLPRDWYGNKDNMRTSCFLLLIFTLLASACATPSPVVQVTQTLRPTATLMPSPTRTLQPTHAVLPTQTPAPTDTPIPPTGDTPTLPPTDTPLPSLTPTLGPPITRTPAPAAECPKPGGQAPTITLSENIDEMERQILAYLDARGSAVGLQEILSRLVITDEEYTYLTRAQVMMVDVTGDTTPDVVMDLVIYPGAGAIRGAVYVFMCKAGRFEGGAVGQIFGLNFSGPSLDSATGLRTVRDMNADGVPEIVFSYISPYRDMEVIGPRDNFFRLFHILEWNGEEFSDLIPAPGEDSPTLNAFVSNGDGAIRDTNGDGTLELVLSFGAGRSPYTWPLYRPRKEIWAWNGYAFAVICVEEAPPVYRVQAVWDGDNATQCGDYDKAIAAYQRVIFDDQLLAWGEGPFSQQWLEDEETTFLRIPPPPDPSERLRLSAYARYRIMLLHLVRGYLLEAQIVYDTLQAKFSSGVVGHQYAGLATVAWEEYNASNDIAAACRKVMDYLSIHEEEFFAPSHPDPYISYTLHARPEDICSFK